MILDLIIAALKPLFFGPLSLLPTWSPTMVVSEIPAVDQANAMLPFGDLLEIVVLLCQAGLIALPIVFLIWIWNTVKP